MRSAKRMSNFSMEKFHTHKKNASSETGHGKSAKKRVGSSRAQGPRPRREREREKE